jgi:hypothetical protein
VTAKTTGTPGIPTPAWVLALTTISSGRMDPGNPVCASPETLDNVDREITTTLTLSRFVSAATPMNVVPWVRAVTLPEAFTAATAGLLLLHVGVPSTT